jgi:predicted DNA-binding transcriptional regulator AlpA
MNRKAEMQAWALQEAGVRAGAVLAGVAEPGRDALRVKEISDRTGVSETFWWDAIKEGKVKALKLGPKTVVVPRTEYERVLREGI